MSIQTYSPCHLTVSNDSDVPSGLPALPAEVPSGLPALPAEVSVSRDGTLSDFLEWAKSKTITVTWCYGSLCNSEKLENFDPNASNESIESFLERVVAWVMEHSTHDDDVEDSYDDSYVFCIEEDSFNISELIALYKDGIV
jgi:hypothetical protein